MRRYFLHLGIVLLLICGAFVLPAETGQVGFDAAVPQFENCSTWIDPGIVTKFHSAANTKSDAGARTILGGSGAISGLKVVRPEWWNADPTGSVDSFLAVKSAIAAVAEHGGIVEGTGTYLINSGNLHVNKNNVYFRNCTFKRTSEKKGWMLRFATTNSTQGGGVFNCRFIADPTVDAPNGGVAFGTQGSHKANNFTVEDVTCDGLAQYGVGIWDGDKWTVSKVNILNHGSTHPGTPVRMGIGFFVYPKSVSKGGQLNTVYAEINPRSTITKSAAIKLQTHSSLTAKKLIAVGGTESSISIDSIEGVVSDVTVQPDGNRVGLVVGNYNTRHQFSGQIFTVSDVSIKGTSLFGFVIGAGADGEYKLSNCTLQRIKGFSARYLKYSNMSGCTLRDWEFEAIQLDSAILGYQGNSLRSNNNTYSNIITTGGTLPGYMYVEASNSVFNDCGTKPRSSGKTTSVINIRGSGNVINSVYSINSDTNALVIDGDRNKILDYRVVGAAGRTLWLKPGSTGNIVKSEHLDVGKGVLDSGDKNILPDKKRRR